MRKLYLYELGPHDWWGGWIDLEKHKPIDFADDYMGNEAAELESQVSAMLEAATSFAKTRGWEGDMTQGPYLSAIPNEDNAIYLALGWKQSNNGTTYVASSIPLPHLQTPRGSTEY